jgi:gliding motility-associated-like protein
MKRLLFIILLLFSAFSGFAFHLKGGFFTYTYLGKTGNTVQYRITLNVYMDCAATGAQLESNVNFTFFEANTNSFIRTEQVNLTAQFNLSKDTDEKCITGNQAKCYYKILVYDLGSVSLPISTNGYTISYQRCCRITGINNIANSQNIGNTYSITIPGTAVAPDAETNNSAQFLLNDTIVVCGGSEFKYSFLADDLDGDILNYTFCEAWSGASSSSPRPDQADKPPYEGVPYDGGYFGADPLGPDVTIDPNTGLISGIAPSAPGEYVVTVCVTETRDGKVIATNRKELHMQVGDCVPIKASLNPSYITCDGFTLTFQNNAASNEIENYFWDLGVPSLTNDTSSAPVVSYTYTDTGVYTIKLIVNRGLACTDSTTAQAKVYPGFFPEFSSSGICMAKPTKFTDQTTATYGTVNSWAWDFGNSNSSTDVSSLQNPTYTYPAIGTYNIRLIVASSKGCKDTLTKPLTIIDKPPLQVRFKDTLICNGDALQLEAIGKGIFSWTPAGSDIVNENTATPIVTPVATKKYYVLLDDNGCLNRDSVRVRVVDFVTVKARADTTICSTDSVQLNAVSDGLQFMWSPSVSIGNPKIINPMAAPTGTTTYTVTAIIGHCSATDDLVVKTVPYPGANAGADTVICYGTSAQLNGSIMGSSFNWSPASSLTNQNTLSPVANPPGTTTYTLTVKDTIGCPKPGKDNVVVKVLPKIQAFAGADTAVVVGEPLHFHASGGVKYLWSPAAWLNKTDIADPIAIYNEEVENVSYKVEVFNEANCVDSAFVTVKIFKTNPQVFVPTAFTPNGDGKNDLIKPIAVGISRIQYFQIFNRWGQLVFSTTINGKGWDGKIAGKDQASGTFVWLVKGTAYTGKSFFAKGTLTLIR